MKKLYECEISRTNVSPKQFFTYCKNQMPKRTGHELDTWCEDFNDWADEKQTFENKNTHDDWDNPQLEVLTYKPYEWHIYLEGCYNFIMEWFDGHGYMYAVEYDR